MPELIPVLSKEQIHERVRVIAEKISRDYREHNLVLVGVLKGAVLFLSDLIRELTIPARIDFVQISSYGGKTVSSEKLLLKKKIELDIRGADVLIIEDIVDTGLTMAFLIGYLSELEPRTIKTCTFLDKCEHRKIAICPDYACHTVGSGFLVGYGLDYNEYYRTLPGVYRLKA